MNVKLICHCIDMLGELEGEEDDGSSRGKGGGTSTGATRSKSNGGGASGKLKLRAAASEGHHKGTDSNSNGEVKKKTRTLNGGGTSAEAPESRSTRGSVRGKAASTEKCCLHCGKSSLHGAKVKLHECACGKVYHHLCAGKVNHEDFAVCYACSQSSQSNSSASAGRSTLRTALDALLEGHQRLLNFSSEKLLCSPNESKQKAQQFDKACTTVKDQVISAWRAWSSSDTADPAETRELQDLIGQVLLLVKETVQFREVDFVRKKVQGKNFN